ncbi:MAG: SMI1/KNR4 family protein [Chitinophagaceae bacterium]|nr:SMI1/KNR4 family protein [Chitinophagaceae bacterium]
MKQMKANPEIEGIENYGMSLQEIEAIEKEREVRFPVAYKEFLLLGGKGANMLDDFDHQLLGPPAVPNLVFWRDLQENFMESMMNEGVLPERKLWIFAGTDSEQCYFFHFNDGDDPKIYFYSAFLIDNDTAGVTDIGQTFSQFINELIDLRRKEGY